MTATTPAGAGTLAPNANLSVTFSEPVNVTGNWFSISCPGGVRTVADTTVTGGPQTFTIDPTTDLVNGQACTFTIVGVQITDQDAIDPPDVMAADLVVAFTVGSGGGPNTPPTISPTPVDPVGTTLATPSRWSARLRSVTPRPPWRRCP